METFEKSNKMSDNLKTQNRFKNSADYSIGAELKRIKHNTRGWRTFLRKMTVNV